MACVQAQVSVLVCGSNAFLPFLELVMYILHPQMTRSVNGILYEMFLCLYYSITGDVPRRLLIIQEIIHTIY